MKAAPHSSEKNMSEGTKPPLLKREPVKEWASGGREPPVDAAKQGAPPSTPARPDCFTASRCWGSFRWSAAEGDEEGVLFPMNMTLSVVPTLTAPGPSFG